MKDGAQKAVLNRKPAVGRPPPAVTGTLRLLEKGMRRQAAKRFDEAAGYYDRILAIEPDNVDANYMRSQVFIEQRDFDSAIKYIERTARLNKGNAELSYLLALNLYHLRRYFDAIRQAKQALKTEPNHRLSLLLLGKINARLGRRKDAVAYIDALCRLPARADPLEALTLADVLLSSGRIGEAEVILRRLIADDKTVGRALFDLTKLPGARLDAHCRRRIDDLLRKPGISQTDKMLLHFAAGFAEDAAGHFDAAFAHYAAANRLSGGPFDVRAFADTVETLRELFSPDFFHQRAAFGDQSALPVFVVGMPRSGKSLIERYLAGHPLIRGVGEIGLRHLVDPRFVVDLNGQLPDKYVERVCGLSLSNAEELARRYLSEVRRYSHDAKRIINTLPQNFQNLGLLALLFPNARFIVVARDPLDNCFACFIKNFQNAHDYTSDLEIMGEYYRNYHRLVQHWRTVLPHRICDVRYEAFVLDPEAELRRLVEFLGLDQRHRLIDDHGEPVAWSHETALAPGPVNSSQIGRWRNYERHLGPLIEALGDLTAT